MPFGEAPPAAYAQSPGTASANFLYRAGLCDPELRRRRKAWRRPCPLVLSRVVRRLRSPPAPDSAAAPQPAGADLGSTEARLTTPYLWAVKTHRPSDLA